MRMLRSGTVNERVITVFIQTAFSAQSEVMRCVVVLVLLFLFLNLRTSKCELLSRERRPTNAAASKSQAAAAFLNSEVPSKWAASAPGSHKVNGVAGLETENSRLFLIFKEATRGRTLSQYSGYSVENGYDCALPTIQLDTYLDAETRTWLLTDVALEEIRNDLQAIVNCTQEGDTILFDVSRRIRAEATVLIPWRLTISGYVNDTSLRRGGAFRESQSPVTFMCPNETEGVFLVKDGGVLLANLVFEGCAFNSSEASRAIIEAEVCKSESTTAIQLHHVTFSRNTLATAAGLRVNEPSCAEVEMIHVAFLNNICGGVCGAQLSAVNVLQNARIKGNKPVDGLEQEPVILRAPRNSHTSAARLSALRNRVKVFSGTAVSLSLKESTFHRNSVELLDEDYGVASLIVVADSTLRIEDSSFVGNSGHSGAIVHAIRAAVTLDNSIFRGNNATYGGVVYLRRSTTLDAVACNFTSNNAMEGGVFLLHLSSKANFTTCEFTGNNAEHHGGAIYAEASEVMTERCLFSSGDGFHGGFLWAHCASVVLSDSSFVKGSANVGGAIRVENSSLTGSDLVFRGNTAEGSGGGLYCLSLSTLLVDRSEFRDNSARAGSAILASFNTSVSFASTRFINNTASEEGGSIDVSSASAKFRNCSMEANKARWSGGDIVSWKSDVKIIDSSLRGSKARHGGCIHAFNSSLLIRDSKITNQAAGSTGGALRLEDSTLKAQRLSISSCKARNDGGAIYSDDSRVLCRDCVLENNRARKRGGAVSFRFASDEGRTLQLERSTLRNNSATIGGGLHITRRRKTRLSSSLNSGYCAVIRGTTFLHNQAKDAGGAIFATHLKDIRVDCDPPITEDRLKFAKKDEVQALNRLDSRGSVCDAWAGNRAGSYADDVGGYGRFVKKTIIHGDANGTETVVNGDSYVVSNHRSGAARPGIRLELLDELKQGPAVYFGKRIEAKMTAPDDSFSVTIRPMIRGVAEFSDDIFYQNPGEYLFEIEFSGQAYPTFTIVVHVRDCILGEHAAQDGRFCDECSGDTFALRPEDECQPCPENADCDSTAIRPHAGYWLGTPCSEHPQRCLTRKACDYEERNQKLRDIEQVLETCELTEETAANYSVDQCSEGYEGPLCGSCLEDFGRSQSFTCVRCFTWFGNVALVLLSIAVLVAISSLPIRSNLFTRNKTTASLPIHRRKEALMGAPHSARSVAVEMGLMEMYCTGHVPKEVIAARETAGANEGDIENSAEIAKWKAVELFKITVNFLQVTAVAISINVEWTVGLITFFEAAEFISGVTSEAVNRSVDCIVSSSAPVQPSILASVIDTVVPVAVIGLFSCFWLVIALRNGETRTYFFKRTALSAIAVLYISYISLTKTLVNTLNCISVYDSLEAHDHSRSSYWAVDTSLQCYKGSHAVLAGALGLPLLLLFCVGFPASVAYMILKHVAKDCQRGWIYNICGFLYRAYRHKFVFWESIVMLKKAALAVVVVFAYPLGSTLQSILAVLVMAIAQYFQTVCRPYRDEFSILNKMEGVSILVSQVTFLSSLFFQEDVVPRWGHIVVTVAIALCNTAILIYFVAHMFAFAAEYLKAVLDEEKVSYNPKNGTFHVLKVYLLKHLLIKVAKKMARIFRSNIISSQSGGLE